MVEYDSEVRRFDELKRGSGGSATASELGELDRSFYDSLTNNQERYGGGGCYKETHYPVPGSVTLHLAAYEGDSPSDGTVSVTTVTLDEGDTATIGTGASEYRIKLFGSYMARPDAEQIVNDQTVAFGIDVWLERQSCWNTLEKRTGASDSIEYTNNGTTIRITIADGLGFEPESDFMNLVEQGLSPAEALDYWMVDVRHHPQNEWAEMRGKTVQAISKNVGNAREKIDLGELPHSSSWVLDDV